MKNPSIGGTEQETQVNRAPRIRELVGYFLRLGTLGFGGPVALCGLMEKELVQDRGWLSKQEMRDAIAVSQSLPGITKIPQGPNERPIVVAMPFVKSKRYSQRRTRVR